MPPLKSFKELASDSDSCWQGSAGTGVTVGCTDSLVGLHAHSLGASTCCLFLPWKKKNKKTHKAPGLGSRFWGFLKYFTCAVLSDGWHPLQSWFLFEMKSPHGYDPERNKNQGQEYLGCQGHGVSSRELALLQLVFSSPTLPSFLEPLDKLRTRYYFQNLGENGKQINLLFSFLTSTDKCQPLIPMPKIIRNVLSQTCKVRMT